MGRSGPLLAVVAVLPNRLARSYDEGLLEIGAPRDEYEPEIETIVPMVVTATSAAEVQGVIHDGFVRWFGAGIAGAVDAYEEPARAIWHAVPQFRGQGVDPSR